MRNVGRALREGKALGEGAELREWSEGGEEGGVSEWSVGMNEEAQKGCYIKKN